MSLFGANADQYEGRGMAQVMSFVIVFILIPHHCSSIGRAIVLLVAGDIFVLYTCCWRSSSLDLVRHPAAKRHPPERRVPFTVMRLRQCPFAEVLTNRMAFDCTITAGFVYGAFLMPAPAQQIFQQTYGPENGFRSILRRCGHFGSGAASYPKRGVRPPIWHETSVLRALLVNTTLSSSYSSLPSHKVAPLATPPLLYHYLLYHWHVVCLASIALAMEPSATFAEVPRLPAVIGFIIHLTLTILGTIVGQILTAQFSSRWRI
ncbi:MAG: hypothetical protein H6668_12320 [Ardenticatenaceae bacterium]|nr:hypothetical protein [Ardenticatenaceae bacterium]